MPKLWQPLAPLSSASYLTPTGIKLIILIFLLFWVLLIWGLLDSEIYLRDALIYFAIWLASFPAFLFLPIQEGVFIAAGVGVILDVVLILKVMGGNPTIS